MPASSNERQDELLFFKTVHLVSKSFEVDSPLSHCWTDSNCFSFFFYTECTIMIVAIKKTFSKEYDQKQFTLYGELHDLYGKLKITIGFLYSLLQYSV